MIKKACQEGIKIIENCGENRLKNSIFDNVLLKTMFYSILQPFWTVLARFWDIWGHFWVHSMCAQRTYRRAAGGVKRHKVTAIRDSLQQFVHHVQKCFEVARARKNIEK